MFGSENGRLSYLKLMFSCQERNQNFFRGRAPSLTFLKFVASLTFASLLQVASLTFLNVDFPAELV